MTVEANRSTIGTGAQRLLLDLVSLLESEYGTGTA